MFVGNVVLITKKIEKRKERKMSKFATLDKIREKDVKKNFCLFVLIFQFLFFFFCLGK